MPLSSFFRPTKESRSKTPTKWYPDWLNKLGDAAFKGKTVVITGCTTGIGHVVAMTAASRGARQVFMLNRKSGRADAALESVIAKAASGTEVRHIDCDLQSFASVHAAAAQVQGAAADGAVDVLYCNAGIMAFDEAATEDGFDVQAQTNHLSHFLLARETMPLLERAASLRGEGRIVSISSGAREHPKTPFDAKYFEAYQGPGSLGGNGKSMIGGGANWERYHQTKLANVVFTMALHDRLQAAGSRIKAVVCEPGLTASDLQTTTSAEGGMGAFSLWLVTMLSQSVEDGALPSLKACFAPDTQSGDFFAPQKAVFGPPVHVLKAGEAVKRGAEKLSLDVAARDALWQVSEAAIGGAPFVII